MLHVMCVTWLFAFVKGLQSLKKIEVLNKWSYFLLKERTDSELPERSCL